MNRNAESHFGHIPTKRIRRSKFKRDCRLECTMNTGDIVPIYFEEVYPGDTCKMHVDSLIRMLTPINPVMDQAFIDLYFFFSPRRLTWEHFEEFMGANKTDSWTQKVEYTIPQLEAPKGGWDEKSIAHYLGARMFTEGISIDAQYTRTYTLIYNEWFRNQNLSEPAEMSMGDSVTAGSNGDDYVVDIQKGGHFAKAVKFADYLTRALPEPSKGPDVLIPLGSAAPVYTGEEHDVSDQFMRPSGAYALKFRYTNDPEGEQTYNGNRLLGAYGSNEFNEHNNYLYMSGTQGTTLAGQPMYPDNLWTDLSEANSATINQLRQAFAIQRMFEMDARGGTRYTEILASHFGVFSSDARLQRPEYLGGKRIPINMMDIPQTSATNEVSPQGNNAGMSKTIDNHDCFTKSFEEHGILMGLAVIRTEHSYQQGIPRILNRKTRQDFYWPELANIGEQGIKNKEIFAQGTNEDDEIFGYQEAYAELRYPVGNRICGELNSDYTTPLDSWHYGDDYDSLPRLGDEWVKETDANVARTLAIQNQAQFKADFYFDQTWARPLPIYGIPGLTGWN